MKSNGKVPEQFPDNPRRPVSPEESRRLVRLMVKKDDKHDRECEKCGCMEWDCHCER